MARTNEWVSLLNELPPLVANELLAELPGDLLAERLTRLLASAPMVRDSDQPVVIGCSGGPDSAALVALARYAGCAATVVYIDHGLRPSTSDDFATVRTLASRFGFDAHMISVTVDASANVEARARDARLGALEQFRDSCGADAIWLAHTLDDQAETVLLAVMRGSGLAGLAGMAARRGAIHRPLLGVRRAALRQLCSELALEPVHDPMNDDQRFARVWVRENLLPTLNNRSERDIAPVLARQASLVREEHEFLEQLAADALAAAGSPVSVQSIRDLDRVVLRRVVRRIVGEPPIGGKHVEAALAVVHGERHAVELPNRRTLRRSGGILFVELTPDPIREPLGADE